LLSIIITYRKSLHPVGDGMIVVFKKTVAANHTCPGGV
jgi:hypothetical protein